MNTEITLSAKEETSILLEGDFDQNSYSKILKTAFFQSWAINTKIPDWIKFMPGMSGRKYRYLINNLISSITDARYLESDVGQVQLLVRRFMVTKLRLYALIIGPNLLIQEQLIQLLM